MVSTTPNRFCSRMHFVFTAPRFHTNQHFPAKALIDAGHQVTFLVLRRGQSESYAALTPVVLGCSPVFEILRSLASNLPGIGYSNVGGMPSPYRFLKHMRRLRPSAVVVRDPNSAYGLLATLAAKLTGTKLIVYTQTPKHQRMPWLKRLRFPLMLRLTGATWFTPVLGSTSKYPAVHKALRYVPFVVEAATEPKDKQWFTGGCVNILAIGKFQQRKNHALFVEAIAAVARRYAVHALIVGECSTDEHREVLDHVRQRRTDLGLEDAVEIRTNLAFDEVQRLYATHDLFVLASRGEPAAVSPLEAMAHSLPVICSDSNGTACYIVRGRNGFVFRSDDADDLAACITSVVADRVRLTEMGAQSYQQVLTDHSPARYVDALIEMAS